MGHSFSEFEEKSQFLVLNNAEGLNFFELMHQVTPVSCQLLLVPSLQIALIKQCIFINLYIFDVVPLSWGFFTVLSLLKDL